MRFGRRRMGRGRRPRNPVFWTRQDNVAAQAGGPVALTTAAPTSALTLFQSTIVDSGIDQRLTVRRIRLALNFQGQAVVDNDLEITAGVVFTMATATVRKTTMALAVDQQEDWLDLWRIPINAVGGAPSSLFFTPGPLVRDIRAMRKVDENQIIAIAFTLSRGENAGALSAAQTVNVTVLSSVLFSRTPR